MNLSQKHCLWMWCLLLGATLCSACSSRPKSSQEAKTDATDTVTAATPAAAWYEGEVPFTFDYREDYPETDIRLSELADISYIPLETNEHPFLRRGPPGLNPSKNSVRELRPGSAWGA